MSDRDQAKPLPFKAALKRLREDFPEMFATKSLAAKSERALKRVYRERRRRNGSSKG